MPKSNSWTAHSEHPFYEKQYRNVSVRYFPKGLTQEDLPWHWDDEDRIVVSMHDNDWSLEYEDGRVVPVEKCTIKAGQYHRLIPGKGRLKIMIISLPEFTIA